MFEFTVEVGGSAGPRCGLLTTPHGEIPTPVFMPVGTQATVKAMTQEELESIGFSVILGNTYHLYLRPGHELVQRAGGLHRFMSWSGAILTDSGGFQVYSLSGTRRIQEDGVWFKSYLDGSEHLFTPRGVIQVQQALGADIIMAFDECPPFPCSQERVREAMGRTLRWADQCVEQWRRGDIDRQALFPIVQGGFFRTLREESATRTATLPAPGFAIGGVSVGEPSARSLEVLEWTVPLLPGDRPRYLMGVGAPADLLEGIERGVDMFDCVLPTRLGRNGSVYTSRGRRNLRAKAYEESWEAVDPECGCTVCVRYSAAYLRHLFRSDEILGGRLASFHNLYFYYHLMEEARTAIRRGCFDKFKRTFLERCENDKRTTR